MGAIGSSLRLKQRFGSGYQLSVSVLPPSSGALDADDVELLEERAEAVKAFFKVIPLPKWPRTACSGLVSVLGEVELL